MAKKNRDDAIQLLRQASAFAAGAAALLLAGIGRLAIQSIYNRDYPIVQACVFLTAAMFVVLNFLVDVAYGLLDPRIRHQ